MRLTTPFATVKNPVKQNKNSRWNSKTLFQILEETGNMQGDLALEEVSFALAGEPPFNAMQVRIANMKKA